MFRTLIKYLQLGLELLKADPAEKEQIEALQAQVTTLNAELAAARTQTPSADETEQISALLSEFAAIEAVKPVLVAEPQPDPADTPPEEASASEGMPANEPMLPTEAEVAPVTE